MNQKKYYGKYPLNVCANAGYGSLENYSFLFENNIGNYVKYFNWEGNVSGRNPSQYTINEDNSITCLNGLNGIQVNIENRHPKKANAVFYKIEGCNNCAFLYVYIFVLNLGLKCMGAGKNKGLKEPIDDRTYRTNFIRYNLIR